MGAHIIDGEFQSDKYPTTPRGKVPLSVKDETAQDLLWEYAQRRRAVDAEFAADLETALKAAGYVPPLAFEDNERALREGRDPLEPGANHPDPTIDAEVRAEIAKADLFDLAAGVTTWFTCPNCYARHDRGAVNGVDAYRCLRCGETTKIEKPVAAATATFGGAFLVDAPTDPSAKVERVVTAPNTKWRPAPPTFTIEAVTAALRNFGISLECGLCASIFFTGSAPPTAKHDTGCTTYTAEVWRRDEPAHVPAKTAETRITVTSWLSPIGYTYPNAPPKGGPRFAFTGDVFVGPATKPEPGKLHFWQRPPTETIWSALKARGIWPSEVKPPEPMLVLDGDLKTEEFILGIGDRETSAPLPALTIAGERCPVAWWIRRERPPETPTFTLEQVTAGLRNFGMSLECGTCASVFFTGTAPGTAHEAGCTAIRYDRLKDALETAAHIMTKVVRDWAKHPADAWLYGILVGWTSPKVGDSALLELASIHRWDEKTVARLKELRAAVQAVTG